ncbi:RNA 2',3'-cyclic phosphodiesterase [Rhodopirellula sp. JC740]|uniref:RNA 2',3'-cyclic phosphodiesterase n=1 Tax=Rhodopirellula halodulae TaxID=2894198 RepID=A0ABS8NJU4_9BACT|nr:RNA 2',3'-cyclic phosphodiesterase [Rhodopirellula sp. JC740]MCC9643815.1 RNA 2',3'-cyclic phosphodiesterase [Rhodopirellula sp. JC740]
MKTIRTFVAIPLPSDIARTASRWMAETKTPGDGIKWVPEENLHLTLKFLGEVDNVETPAVCNTVEDACEELDPFPLTLGGASGIPVIDRPRVLTIDVDDPTSSLVQLVADLEKRFAALGYKPESRDYRPHLTVGRTRSGTRRANSAVVDRWRRFADDEVGEMTVNELHVVGSFLEKHGPSYNVLGRVQL